MHLNRTHQPGRLGFLKDLSGGKKKNEGFIPTLVGRTRLELVTSALSRQRSEPTELTTYGCNIHIGFKDNK